MACPHGMAGPCWMPRVGVDQMGLAHHPAPIESFLLGSVSMGREACCCPTPHKIWAKSSVGINSFSLINFNETTQISTHSGWL